MSENKYQTRINFKERVLIESYLKDGLSASKIALEIGRSKNGVITEIRRGGGRDNYCSKQSQLIMDQKEAQRLNKMKEINKKYTVLSLLQQKVENLEMQIEILYDTIKEILKNE